jgi:hypothetical protein
MRYTKEQIDSLAAWYESGIGWFEIRHLFNEVFGEMVLGHNLRSALKKHYPGYFGKPQREASLRAGVARKRNNPYPLKSKPIPKVSLYLTVEQTAKVLVALEAFTMYHSKDQDITAQTNELAKEVGELAKKRFNKKLASEIMAIAFKTKT